MSKRDPRLSGGVESVVMGILSALKGTPYEVTVTFFGDAGREDIMARTKQYRSTGMYTIDVLIYGFFAGLEARRDHYDLVNVHGEVGFAYGAMHRIRRRCGKLIATSHGVAWYALGSYSHLLPWYRRVLLAIYRPIMTLVEGITFSSADTVVAVSKGVADEIVRLYHIDPRKIEVVHNHIDISAFHPRPRDEAIKRLGLDEDKRYLLYVGREYVRKNLAMAVAAVRALRDRGHIYELLAVGIAKDQLPAWARDEHVRALGKVSLEDFPYLFNASDALLHPSLYEGHPITPLEALASGLPVVASAASKLEIPPYPFIRIVDGYCSEDYADAVIEMMSLHPDAREIANFRSELGWTSYDDYVQLFNSEEAKLRY
jgi:glycosyltransferase involved in cell wall biosynthesis